MALTREERNSIEKLIKRVRDLETTVTNQGKTIDSLLLMVDNISSATNMADWTSAQWEEFLRPYILKYASQSGNISLHDHTSDSQGGDCFAKKGASLIVGEE